MYISFPIRFWFVLLALAVLCFLGVLTYRTATSELQISSSSSTTMVASAKERPKASPVAPIPRNLSEILTPSNIARQAASDWERIRRYFSEPPIAPLPRQQKPGEPG